MKALHVVRPEPRDLQRMKETADRLKEVLEQNRKEAEITPYIGGLSLLVFTLN